MSKSHAPPNTSAVIALRDVPYFILAQLVGALLAAMLARLLFDASDEGKVQSAAA